MPLHYADTPIFSFFAFHIYAIYAFDIVFFFLFIAFDEPYFIFINIFITISHYCIRWYHLLYLFSPITFIFEPLSPFLPHFLTLFFFSLSLSHEDTPLPIHWWWLFRLRYYSLLRWYFATFTPLPLRYWLCYAAFALAAGWPDAATAFSCRRAIAFHADYADIYAYAAAFRHYAFIDITPLMIYYCRWLRHFSPLPAITHCHFFHDITATLRHWLRQRLRYHFLLIRHIYESLPRHIDDAFFIDIGHYITPLILRHLFSLPPFAAIIFTLFHIDSCRHFIYAMIVILLHYFSLRHVIFFAIRHISLRFHYHFIYASLRFHFALLYLLSLSSFISLSPLNGMSFYDTAASAVIAFAAAAVK